MDDQKSVIDESNLIKSSSGMMSAEDIERRKEERHQVIYGHADIAKQVVERAAIEAAMETLRGSGDTDTLSKLKFKRDNIGRLVTLDTFIALEGSDSKKWQIKPTCSCCGETVHFHGVNSLRTTTKYLHPPIDPTTTPEERCRLRSNLNKDHENGSSHAVSAATNRRNFYQPEIVGTFVMVARAILGRGAYTPQALDQMLVNADKLKVWDKVHDPELAPFQLLGLETNRFPTKFKNGNIDDVSFVVEKHLTPQDRKQDSTVPSDIRLYGRFTDRLYQGEGRLHSIPGLWEVRENLVSEKQVAASNRAGIFHAWQEPLFVGPPPPLQAHYGHNRTGHEFIVVSLETTQRLATVRYTETQKRLTSGQSISAQAQSFIQRVDALMGKFAAGPIREPRVSKAKATPQPVGAT